MEEEVHCRGVRAWSVQISAWGSVRLRIYDLSRFILNPDTVSNRTTSDCRGGREVDGSARDKSTSSVNSDILCRSPVKGILSIAVFALIAVARGSILRAKRRGERGHPCLVPLEWKKEG